MKKIANNLLGMLFIAVGIYTLYTTNLHASTFKTVWVKEAYKYIKHHRNLTILDVRSEDEFEDDGSILSATLIPLPQLSKMLNQLDKSKTILVYCRSGSRSAVAAQLLSKHGFRVLNMKGGMNAWIDSDLPYEF